MAPKADKVCRVCGKVYPTCHTYNANNKFRWQDVACSPECGEEYLRRILVSRGQAPAEPVAETVSVVEDEVTVDLPSSPIVDSFDDESVSDGETDVDFE